jgi:hypothetical protein
MTDEELGELMRQCWNEYPGISKFDPFKFGRLVAAPLEEEIRRLRFCIPEGDAAAAMEYLAYCVEKAVAVEREACAKVCEKDADCRPRHADIAYAFADAIRARDMP